MQVKLFIDDTTVVRVFKETAICRRKSVVIVAKFMADSVAHHVSWDGFARKHRSNSNDAFLRNIPARQAIPNRVWNLGDLSPLGLTNLIDPNLYFASLPNLISIGLVILTSAK